MEIPEAGPSGTHTPSSLLRARSSSYKGKERAVSDVAAVGEIARSNDDDVAKSLRQIFHRSMSGLSADNGLAPELEDLDQPPGGSGSASSVAAVRRRPRRYIVSTHAGKPVFCSKHWEGEDTANLAGISQALISILGEDGDRLRSIKKGKTRMTFLLKPPLQLFCISDWGEPESTARAQLESIHLQLLSIVTSTQISRAFQKRSNFDLGRLLEGTEHFLHAMVDRCQTDFSFWTSTLQPLRMPPAVRDMAASALTPPKRMQDLLYVLLIAGGHIVTLLRPRKHAIHPSDLHLLLNTLATSESIRSTETWIPICFPKFNPAGYVHAFISYDMPDIGLVFVSADREAFEELRAWKATVVEALEKNNVMNRIAEALPLHEYSVADLACQGLLHFMYRSKNHVQVTSPRWEGLYAEQDEARDRVITAYQRMMDTLHARSGQHSATRLLYLRSDSEAYIGWATKPFELYATVSPLLPKSAVVGVANAIASWVAAEEVRLFLRDAPVF